jgi:DNA-binding phage protein
MEAHPKEIRYYVTEEDVSPFLVCGQSKSYREFLLENLQDEAHAAGYLTVALTEEDADAAFLKQLMQSTIDDVIEARSIDGMVSPEVNALRDRFATAQTNGSDIQVFARLLDALGFQLTIVPKSGD